MSGDYWTVLPYIPPAPAPTYQLVWPPQDPRVDDLLARVAELEAEVERLKKRRKKAIPE